MPRRAGRVVVMLLLTATPALILILGLLEAGMPYTLAPAIVVNPPLLVFVGVLAMYLGIAFLVLRLARNREDWQRLELRRRLAAGRAFMMHELKRPNPALDDAWFPYLVAFGLGQHIDHWFRAFAGRHSTDMAIATGSSTSGGWSGGGSLFGGGGGW
ncbi:MAG: hypothetical protein ACT4O1_06120 [Gemmatimonadota bacterium]